MTLGINLPRFWFWRFDAASGLCAFATPEAAATGATAGATALLAASVYPWIGAVGYLLLPVVKLVGANSAVIWRIKSMGNDLEGIGGKGGEEENVGGLSDYCVPH